MATAHPISVDLASELRSLFANAKMPTNPVLASEILQLINDPQSGAVDFAKLIRTDPALATRLLKTANSALFAQQSGVTTIERAVTVLGLHRVKTTVLGFQLVSHLDKLGGVPFDMKAFWQHSLLRACLSNAVAQTVIPHRREEAFLIGLLQECGVLLLVQVLGASYAGICRSAFSPWAFHEVERSSFPYTHLDAISVMASEWRLPAIIAIPLERHHQEARLGPGASEIELLNAVSYFVGGLTFGRDALVVPEEAELRQFGSAFLGLDDAAWTRVQKTAIEEYRHVSTLFTGTVADNIDVAELLGEANRRLAAVAVDSEQRAVDVQAEQARIQRDQKRLQQSLSQYRERAALDPLTNVLNRGALTEAVHQAIKANLDEGAPLGLFFLDLDNFKRLNDTYGHQAGDKVLKAVANTLGKEIENTGAIGRYGGEEFVVLLRGPSAEATRQAGERVLELVRQLDIGSLGLQGMVTCSVGAVWSDRLPVNSAEELFAAADQLMYKAKRTGKDRCCFEVLTKPRKVGEVSRLDVTETIQGGEPPPGQPIAMVELFAMARRINETEVEGFVGIRKQKRNKLVTGATLHYFGAARSDLLARPAVTRNLSSGGMGLLVDRPLVRGEPVEVVFDRGSSKIFLAGLVSFCRHVLGKVHEVGVQFVSHSVTPIISGDPTAAVETNDWIARALSSKLEGRLEYAKCE